MTAPFVETDLARVIKVLEQRGHKVRKVKITREGAEVYIDEADPVAATVREEGTTEPVQEEQVSLGKAYAGRV